MTLKKKALVICGPTNSGKTLLAHYLGKKYYGEIINADAMQVYRQIPLITASPSELLKNELPYHLYNFIDVEENFSTVRYAEYAANTVKRIIEKNKIPIIVGGSGLYINTLLYGYNNIPAISNEIRNHTQDLYNKIGIESIWQELIRLDPLASNKLNKNDKQRILRAYEVTKETGKSITTFLQAENFIPLPDIKFETIMLYPERSFLYNKCNERILSFFSSPVIEEIQHLEKYFKENNFTAFKAIGIKEMMSYLNNILTQEKAIQLIAASTRQYAKRQITWFKNQLKDKTIISYINEEEFFQKIYQLDFDF